ncbi:hypothetical protein CsSME_00044675 [Camellia sinensis var. sinensis]|uniref:uncharacterized protein LOC114272373 n=1 Tax=Camellia sinensis TaxID=4442 RepID=UPI001036C8E4|nr:uncharacterized protein LOC114272373 [Camellia sinensis]XP_028082469.1 uncharacterized protein LOC114283797 [Camellia sinensis]
MATTTTRRTPQQGTQTNLFGQINDSFLSITTHSYYNLSQQESTPSSASWHAVLAFIVPVFLTLLRIKYDGKDISAFDTYPKSLGVSIASLLLYCSAYYAELKSSSYEDHRRLQTHARHGAVVFGWLGLVSLTSILLPDSVGPLLYFLYILFLAGEFLCRPLQMLWNWLHHIVMGKVPVMPPSWLTTAHAFSNSRGNNLRRNTLSV